MLKKVCSYFHLDKNLDCKPTFLWIYIRTEIMLIHYSINNTKEMRNHKRFLFFITDIIIYTLHRQKEIGVMTCLCGKSFWLVS